MRSDFALAKEELQSIGIKRVAADFYMEPKRKGSVFFVKSPAGVDRTASLALYPSTNRFCDFSNANYSGDIIGFVAYVKGCNNWQALQMLKDFYGLTDRREQRREEVRRRIELQRMKECRKRERRAAFYRAYWAEIDRLKDWAGICRLAIEKSGFEPFSDEWIYCLNQLQRMEYKLDVLCSVDCKVYARLKTYSEKLPSDYYEWLLDVLAVLAEGGTFIPTKGELKEITAQAAFEIRRKSGAEVRRCSVEW